MVHAIYVQGSRVLKHTVSSLDVAAYGVRSGYSYCLRFPAQTVSIGGADVIYVQGSRVLKHSVFTERCCIWRALWLLVIWLLVIKGACDESAVRVTATDGHGM